jgi:UDP-N-acetylglucosamine--N-acetylmuramyl-(pentapeptide) pyrophosphoryl-undecaprenol N-acetylglucosamine transferase
VIAPARRGEGTTALLAGGGTAGHLAPGFAVREALERLRVRARFVTPGEERERAWFPPGEPPPLRVAAPRLPRRPLAAALFPLRMAKAVLDAHAAIRRERADAVVALGGWPCAPAALAAIVARVPLALLATDAVPGAAVRRLRPLAGRTYVTTDEAAAALSRDDSVRVVGRLVRPGVLGGRRDAARFGLDSARATLYVVGGSLGARGLNEAVVAGLRAAVAARPGLPALLQAIHSTGPGEDAAVAAAYAALGIPAHVAPFVAEVGDALATADLVVCRGGASTLAELEAVGRPAVVVPYPHHADRQQWKNAAPLVERGAALLVEEGALDAERFERDVVGLVLDPERLGRLDAASRQAAAGGGRGGDAAAALASDLVRFIGDRVGRRRTSPGRRTSRPGGRSAAPVEAPRCTR